MTVQEDPPFPSGRGQGEGLRITVLWKSEPSRRPGDSNPAADYTDSIRLIRDIRGHVPTSPRTRRFYDAIDEIIHFIDGSVDLFCS
jgi:hypothetical protein